jgi:hypothetical protein
MWHAQEALCARGRRLGIGGSARASCLLGPARRPGGCAAGPRLQAVGWLELLAGIGGCLCLVELLGKPLMLGSGGVEVGFGSLGADAERGSCRFGCGDACVGGGAVLVAFAAGVGSDEGDFLGSLGLGAVGALLGGRSRPSVPVRLPARPGVPGWWPRRPGALLARGPG